VIGRVLAGRYELREPLSSSPIFENFGAIDRETGGEVCVRLLKKPLSDEADFVAALRSVVSKISQFDHPNIGGVSSLESSDGQIYLVCQWLRGSSLVDRIRRVAPFSPAVVCDTAIPICEALQYAALRGTPHGDLCSDHVLISLDGAVTVVDFGLWESYGRSASAGGLVLSRMAPYLAPEVIDGEMPSPASDVYAVGVILFELLTGRLPYSGQTPMSVLAKHSSQPVPSVRMINPSVPPVFDEIVQKALAKSRSERYASASELLVDLRSVRDALKFGKPLPTTIAQPVFPSEKTASPAWPQRGKGVPMVQTEKRRQPAQKLRPKAAAKRAAEDDVPFWLKAVVFFGAGVLVMGVIGWMVLNLTKKRIIDVPNLIGMTYAEARDKAKASGIRLTVAGEEYNDKFPQPDTIISMDPVPSMRVYEGTSVSVRKSMGATHVDIPDLTGLGRQEAQRRLTELGLKVSNEIREQRSELAIGLVVATDPAHGERVDRNTTVKLTLSTGRQRPRDEEPRPDDMPPNTFTIRFVVRESDEPVQVRVEMTDATGEKQVIFDEEREGGDDVWLEDIAGRGKEATFRIYFNDRLWRTITREGNGT
jgi:serine/threonine-protein kinase